MIYKLYKNVFREAPPKERRKLFSKLYQENDVQLIGVWQNKDNPLEFYMMTAFRNEEHFQEFISIVKEIDEYTQMTQIITSRRETNSVVTLIKTDD